jgi:hypothetical protein
MAQHNDLNSFGAPKCTFCSMAHVLEGVLWVDERLVSHLTTAVRANTITLDQVLLWWPKAGRLVADRLLAPELAAGSGYHAAGEPIDLLPSPVTPPPDTRKRTNRGESSTTKRRRARDVLLAPSAAPPKPVEISPTVPYLPQDTSVPAAAMADDTQHSSASADPIESTQQAADLVSDEIDATERS